jgi:hypothetical protein
LSLADSGCFYSNQGNCSEDRHRDDQDCEQCTPLAAGKGLAEGGVVEEAVNALRDSAGTGHVYSNKGWARQGREFEKELSIRGGASSLVQSGVVANRLSQVAELALEPPSQRAEPEKSCIEGGKKLKVEVALADVRTLVGEHDAELFGIPLGKVGGQQHGRAYGYRRGNSSARTEMQPWETTRLIFEEDRLRAKPQAHRSRDAENHPQNESAGDREVKKFGDRLPMEEPNERSIFD